MQMGRAFWIALLLGAPILLITLYQAAFGAIPAALEWVQLGLALALTALLTVAPLTEVERPLLSPWLLAPLACLACCGLALWALLDPQAAQLAAGGPYTLFVALTALVWAAGRSLARRVLGDVDAPFPPGPDRLVRFALPLLPLAALLAAGIWAAADDSGRPWSTAGLAALAAAAVGPPVTLSFGLSALLLVAAARAAEHGVRPCSWRAMRLDGPLDCVLFADADLFVSQAPSIVDLELAADADRDELIDALKRLDGMPQSELEQHAGLGFRAVLDGREALVGRPELLQTFGVDPSGFAGHIERALRSGAKPTLVAVGGRCLGFLALSATLRLEAALVLQALKAAGCRVCAPRPAGVEGAAAAARLPELELIDKTGADLATQILQWRSSGQRVALVSGPMLDQGLARAADLSVVLGGRAEAVPPGADLLLASPDLDGALHAISLAAALSRQADRVRLGAAAPHVVALLLAAGLLYGTIGLGASPLLGCAALAAGCSLIMLQALPISAWEPGRQVGQALQKAVDALSQAAPGGERRN